MAAPLGLFIKFTDLLNVNFDGVPVFINLAPNLDFILRSDCYAIPAFMVDIDINRAGIIFEQIEIIRYTLYDITAKRHPYHHA